MATSVNSIDYFVTLGVSGSLSLDTSGSASESSFNSQRDLWENAITDIVIVTGDEELDETWEIVEHSLEGNAILVPQIAFQRRKHSKRMDHICKIICLTVGTMIPPCFERVSSSIIAIKRATTSNDGYIAGEDCIDDIIALFLDDEEPLEDYHLLSHDPAYGYCGDSRHSDLTIAYRIRGPLGVADIRYSAHLLDRFPLQDNKFAPLPVNELPTFVFPFGLRVKFSTNRRFPLPTFFTFVFTDAAGGNSYVACLRFYEEIPKAEFAELLKQLYGDDVPLEVVDRVTIFAPKVICVLSSKPFYRAMRRYLRQLYSMSLSILPCPLEFYVASLVSNVPIPYPGGRPIHYVQDAALISETSRAMPAVILDLPTSYSFPYLDLDFSAPMRCLSVEHILIIFALLLQESKIVFSCQSNNMITETMECFRALLFPLKWATTFISRLPDSLTGLFQALGGFLIGFSGMDTPNNDVECIQADDAIHLHGNATNELFNIDSIWMESLTANTYIVDLTANRLFRFDGQTLLPLSSSAKANILNLLPPAPRIRLGSKLQKICSDYHIGPQKTGLMQFDSAFDFQQLDMNEMPLLVSWEKFPTMEIRDGFMSIMIELLGDYNQFIIPPNEQMNKDSFRSMQEEFRVSDYINNAQDSSLRNLRKAICDTQTFEYLLQRRAEGNDFSILFFENAARLQLDYGLGSQLLSVPHAPSKSSTAAVAVTELPAPLYKLLSARQLMIGDNSEIAMYGLFGKKSGNSHPATVTTPSAGRTPPRGAMPYSQKQGQQHVGMSGGSNGVSVTVDGIALSDLLAMVQKMDSKDIVRAFTEEEALLQPAYSHRHELHNDTLKHDNYLLQDRSQGPIVVPGPLKTQKTKQQWLDLLSSSTTSTQDCESYIHQFLVINEDSLRFSYAHGWPKFMRGFLLAGNDLVHNRIAAFRMVRRMSSELMNDDVLKLLRPSYERIPFFPLATRLLRGPHNSGPSQGSPMPNSSQNQAGQPSNLIDFGPNAHEYIGANVQRPEILLLCSALTELAAVSMTMLGIRSLHQLKPYSDVLQALGIVAQLEDRGCIGLLDDAAWRSVLVGCATTGGPLMRQLAWMIHDRMMALGKGKDSLTFGQFTRAATALKATKTINLCGNVIDANLYLEEMGMTWFIQQRALKEQQSFAADNNINNITTAANNSPVSSNGSPVKLSPTPKTLPTADTLGKKTLFSSVSPTNWNMFKSSPPPVASASPVKRVSIANTPQSTLNMPGAGLVASRRVALFTSGASHLICLQFGLSRNSALSFLSSSGTIATPFPKSVCSLARIDPAAEQTIDQDEALDIQPSPEQKHIQDVCARIETLQADAEKAYSHPTINKAGSQHTDHQLQEQRRGSTGENMEAVLNKVGMMIIQGGHAGLLVARKSITGTSETSSNPDSNASGGSTPAASGTNTQSNMFSRGAHMLTQAAVSAVAVAGAAAISVGTNNGNASPTRNDNSASLAMKVAANMLSQATGTGTASPRSTAPTASTTTTTTTATTTTTTTGTGTSQSSGHEVTGVQTAQQPRMVVSAGHSFDFDDENNDDDDEDGDEVGDISSVPSSSGIKTRRKSQLIPETTKIPSDSNVVNDNADQMVETTTSGAATDIAEAARNLCSDLAEVYVEPTTAVIPIQVNSETPESAATSSNDTEASNTDSPPTNVEVVPVAEAVPVTPPGVPLQVTAAAATKRLSTTSTNLMAETRIRQNIMQLQADASQLLTEEFLSHGSCIGIYSRTPCECGYAMLDDETLAALLCQGSLTSLSPPGPGAPPPPPNGQGSNAVRRQSSSGADSPSRQAVAAAQAQLASQKPALPSSRTNPFVNHIICPQCAQPVVPQLHVKIYKKESDVSSVSGDNNDASNESITMIWEKDILYLSPFVVRRKLEELVEKLGIAVIDASWLHSSEPNLFWSIVWYSTRLSLPTGFLNSDTAFMKSEYANMKEADCAISGFNASMNLDLQALTAAVVCVGWRECTVIARIKNLIHHHHQYKSKSNVTPVTSKPLTNECNRYLGIKDVFPNCSEEEIEMLLRAANNMDGSIAGMRRALVEIATNSNVMNFSISGSKRPARNAYVGLLMLFYSYQNQYFSAPDAVPIPMNTLLVLPSAEQCDSFVPEVLDFDKTYLDAIRCAMSPKDFTALATTESELIDNISGKLVAAVRASFGFLL